MLQDKAVFEEISELLALLQLAVENKGMINFHDDKNASENFFMGLFNIIYDLNLQNANVLQTNFPAIDLIDEAAGKCFQITYENTKSKIDETKKKYESHGLSSQYPDLTIFIFAKKNRDPDDQVKYKEDLINAINALDLDNKSKVLSYLKKHLKSYKEEKKTLEMRTIQAVIGFISEQPLIVNTDDAFLEKPYPEKKLRVRFQDYYEIVKEQFAELYAVYNQLLQQAKADHIDDGNSGKIKAYLRRQSRDILIDNDYNARAALEKVIQDIKDNLDVEIFDGALRFYILSELMECDIFPLSQSEKTSLGLDNGAS